MEAAYRSNTEPGAVKSYYLTAEIDPPKGTNLEGFLFRKLKIFQHIGIKIKSSCHAYRWGLGRFI